MHTFMSKFSGKKEVIYKGSENARKIWFMIIVLKNHQKNDHEKQTKE